MHRDVLELNMASDDTVSHSMVHDVNVFCGWAESSMIEERERCLVVGGDGHDRDRLAKVLEHFP
jgi:hypothetical protein